MLTKEERRQLKEQEQEYKKQAKKKREETKKQLAEKKNKDKQDKKEHKSFLKLTEKPKTKSSDQKMVLSVFPIRNRENGYFLTDDDRIIDLFQVQGRSYYDASDEDIENLVHGFARFLRRFSADMKFIGMNYPTNTKLQQSFLTYKLEQPYLKKYDWIIEQKLATLQTLEKTTTDREAFIIIFANNVNQYESLCQLLLNNNYFTVKPISEEKKDNIIFQLNNMNKNVKI